MAGCITISKGILPYRSSAVTIPSTVPGTPTAKIPSQLNSGLNSPSFTYIFLVARAGTFSLKSNAVEVPSESSITINPPPPIFPALGSVTAKAN